MYDNIWYNDSTGIIPQLADRLNNSLTDDVRNNSWNKTSMFKDAFGIGRVICIALVPICIVIQAVDKPRIQG